MKFECNGITIRAVPIDFGDDLWYELMYENGKPVSVKGKNVRVVVKAEFPKDDDEVISPRTFHSDVDFESDENMKLIQETIDNLYEEGYIKEQRDNR